MMNKKILYSSMMCIAMITVLLSGCIDNQTSDRIGVLVTIVPQIEMVEFIGGDYVDVTVMVPAGESPHSFEPTPDQMIKVSQATAYFKVGSGVEFELVHMATILEQNPNLKVFDCSEEITVVSFDEHYGHDNHHDEGDEHSHDEGEHHNENHGHSHDHGSTDPHVWTSPLNFKKMAEVVYNGLVEINPENQQEYYSNYEDYILKLDNLNANVSDKLDPYEGRSFMVYHPAWGYFGDTYNLRMIAIEAGGKQPGPAGIAAIIEQAQNENITVIFVSPQFDTSSAETIAAEIGGSVVFANPLMTNYESTILKLAQDMVTGFEES
jgi:zinc transport system substrate-binding protein